MRTISRLTSLAATGLAAATLAACSSYPLGPTATTYPSYPTSTAYPGSTMPVAGTEFGRIVNIEYMPVGTAAPGGSGVLGAVVGGVVGGLLGNQIGSGSGRTAATVLGGVAGAAVGSQIARNQQGITTQAGYRITMQTDQGLVRTYEVPATGDLRVGDRVRVDNGVIYRG